jgi:nicotinamidase-related amidase
MLLEPLAGLKEQSLNRDGGHREAERHERPTDYACSQSGSRRANIGFEPADVAIIPGRRSGLPVSSGSMMTMTAPAPGALLIDTAHAAMLSLDMQAGIVSVYVKDESFIPRVARTLDAARTAGIPVVHVKVGFRPLVPEANARNMFLSAIKASPPHQQFFQGASGAIHPDLGVADRDLVVTKSRVSAFTGTDLELLLRAKDVRTLVLFGIATSGVVLSTVLEAADRDYRLIVVKDCCADLDADLHDALVDKLFPRQATVVSADYLIGAISRGDAPIAAVADRVS